MGAKLHRKRSHRFVIGSGCDPQGSITPPVGLSDQFAKQSGPYAAPAKSRLHAECDLRFRLGGFIRWMQLRRATHNTTLEIGDNRGAVACAFCGVAFDETVIQKTLKAIVSAFAVKPQQVIAKKRQFFLMTELSNDAFSPGLVFKVLVSHVKLLSATLEEAFESLAL